MTAATFSTKSKIHRREDWSALRDRIDALRDEGQKMVFTNGCFDLIHVGHVRLLRWAKSQGDILVVALNSDASVRRLKGEDRPKLNEAERLRVMGAMECVDFVTVFEEDTPKEIIEYLIPDVLIKGADWREQSIGIVGEDFVAENGGKTIAYPLVEGKSTTALIERTAKK